jgi:UPF0755 protein
MTSEARPEKRSAGGCLLRLAVVVVVLAAMGATAAMLLRGPLRADPDVNPALDPVRRTVLKLYLSEHAEELAGPAGSGAAPVIFAITPGEGAAAVAENLRAAGLLNNPELFLNYLTYYGLDGGLVAGEYQLNPQATIPELAEALGSGRAQTLELRFLAGWRSEEMANYLAVVAPAQIDAADFREVVSSRRGLSGSYSFLASLPEGASLEGYLFPDAYTVAPDTTAVALVDSMLARFDATVTPAMRQAYGTLGLSLRDAVVLASIIEKEAVLDEEKPLMAAVFLNRLAAGMPLQADPTVQYALGYQAATGSWWKAPLSAEDLAVASPYNTYLAAGLPPGPISNPGLASLAAVANPAAVDYLFFVVDCAATTPGAHVFSVTYDEHLANVARCR